MSPETRIQVVSVLASAALLLLIVGLVRSRRLLERYALLWLFSAFVLLLLAAWKGALERISHALGIVTPTNALFLIAFGFVLALLLHFSLAVSRLTDQTKVLAQRLALLEQRMSRRERTGEDEEAEQPADRLSGSTR